MWTLDIAVGPPDPADRSRRHPAVVVAARSPHRLLGRRPGDAEPRHLDGAGRRRTGGPGDRRSGHRRHAGLVERRALPLFLEQPRRHHQPVARGDRRDHRRRRRRRPSRSSCRPRTPCTRRCRATGGASPTWRRRGPATSTPSAFDLARAVVDGPAAVDPGRAAPLGGPAGVARWTAPGLRPGQPAARPVRDGGRRRRTPQRLTDDRIGIRCPAWSPDGRSLVVLSTRRGDKDLIFVEPDGGRTRRLTDLPSTGMVGCPAWSPDRPDAPGARAGPDRSGGADHRSDAAGRGAAARAAAGASERHLLSARLVAGRDPPRRHHRQHPGRLRARDRGSTRWSRRARPIVAASDMVWLPDNRRLLAVTASTNDPRRRHRHRRGPADLQRRAGRHPRFHACRRPGRSSTSAAVRRKPISGSPRSRRSRMLGIMPICDGPAAPAAPRRSRRRGAGRHRLPTLDAGRRRAVGHRRRPPRRPRPGRPWSRAASARSPTAPPSTSTR